MKIPESAKWIAPPLAFIVAILGYPTAFVLLLTLRDQTLLGSNVTWVGLQNYIEILGSEEFWEAFGNSAFFTLASILLQTFFGIGLAFLLNTKIRGARIARTLVLYPYLIPTVVAAITFKWMFNEFFGIYSYALTWLGIFESPKPLFGTYELAMFGVILVTFWKFVPFITIFVVSRLATIPQHLYDQAKIDGASALQTFRHVTWPELRNLVILLVLMRSIWLFGVFDIVWNLTGGGPARVTETLPILAYRQAFESYELSQGATTSVISFLIMFVCSVLYIHASSKLER